ncbi:SGNH/GDSL hydrolase family protein [Schwartzia sp. (in: firmicutes)]
MSLNITDEMKTSRTFRLLQNAKSICFAGDSLTEGTINGGIPWYFPIRHLIQGKIFNVSQGGMTTAVLLAIFLKEILRSEAELYVFAIGANDILFRDPEFCAVTAEEYIQNLEKIRSAVYSQRPDAKFIFIAPWVAMDGDASIIGGMKPPDTDAAYSSFTAALKAWCGQTGDIFINANDYISAYFEAHSQYEYLIDFIHPNSHIGVQLYTEAVLTQAP